MTPHLILSQVGRAYYEEAVMIWAILTILVVIWLAALLLNIGSGTVHILAVVAVLLLLYQILKRRGTR